MARLHVAKKLRDQSYELFVGNPKRPFTEFLGWQNRYYDVVGDVLVNTDADRVKFLNTGWRFSSDSKVSSEKW